MFMGDKEFSIKDLEFENFKISLEKEKQREEDNLAISFSSKLIGLLDEKVKIHNANSPNKVSLSDLKRVYRRAGKDCELAQELKKACGQLSLARVSMFLRFKYILRVILAGYQQQIADFAYGTTSSLCRSNGVCGFFYLLSGIRYSNC